MGKKWYRSKTLWVNGIMVIGIILQNMTGQEIVSKEAEAGILAIVNIVLRVITKEGLSL